MPDQRHKAPRVGKRSCRKARLSGDFGHEPKEPLPSGWLYWTKSWHPIDPASKILTVFDRGVGRRITHRLLWIGSLSAELRISPQQVPRIWDPPSTAQQAGSPLSLFQDCCGDRPNCGFAPRRREVQDILQVALRRLRQSVRFQAVPFRPPVERSSRFRSAGALSSRTINALFSALSSRWQAPPADNRASRDIFKVVLLSRRRRAHDSATCGPEELAQLFGPPVWKGCFSRRGGCASDP